MATNVIGALRTHVFLREIQLQCRLASTAAERLQANREHLNTLETWGALQSILVTSANVSKILWPRKVYAARGAHLRSLLQLEANHPLSQRSLRNHFEHYDERIEEWFSTVQSSTYTDQIVGELPWPLREFPQNAQRHFDPATLDLTFRGERLSVSALMTSLADILRRCNAVLGGQLMPSSTS